MKYKTLLLISVAVIIILMSSCSTQKKEAVLIDENAVMQSLEPVKQTVDTLNIYVDPRIELLSAVQLNSRFFVR